MEVKEPEGTEQKTATNLHGHSLVKWLGRESRQNLVTEMSLEDWYAEWHAVVTDDTFI